MLIDRLGISFRLDVTSLAMDANDEPEFHTDVRLPLDATVALLNERLVFSDRGGQAAHLDLGVSTSAEPLQYFM